MKTTSTLPAHLSRIARQIVCGELGSAHGAAFCDAVDYAWRDGWRDEIIRDAKRPIHSNEERRAGQILLKRIASDLHTLANRRTEVARMANHALYIAKCEAGLPLDQWNTAASFHEHDDTLTKLAADFERAAGCGPLTKHRGGQPSASTRHVPLVFWYVIGGLFRQYAAREPSAAIDGVFSSVCSALANGLGMSAPSRRVLAASIRLLPRTAQKSPR